MSLFHVLDYQSSITLTMATLFFSIAMWTGRASDDRLRPVVVLACRRVLLPILACHSVGSVICLANRPQLGHNLFLVVQDP